jgi:ABC-2 type transport system ATP-binding protein
VLRNVDLEINTGELVVMLGPNGVGKTTLLGVMAGVFQPQKGSVEINGWRRRSSEADELAIRRHVVYLPDEPWLPLLRTGREFLLSIGNLYDIDSERLLDHIDRLLRLFELDKEGDWPIRTYSAGQRKKIALSAALVTEAPILLLDEPFSGGLDPSGIMALKQILRNLAAKKGATIVISTPVPELVEELADRIVVMIDGKIAAFDTAAGLRRMTGCTGTLYDVFAQLLHPHIADNLQHYFERGQP